VDRQNRGAPAEPPRAVPLGLVGGGGWASVNSLGTLAALNDAGLLGGLNTIVCTSNGANTTAYALADQVHEALAFFVRKAIVHRTLAPIQNLWRYGRAVNTNFMSQLVAGRLRRGGTRSRRDRSVVEELSGAAGAARDDAASTATRSFVDFLKLDIVRFLNAGPHVHVALTHAETGDGFTVGVDGHEHPVIALSAAIALPIGYPSKVLVQGKPAIDGGFALSNVPLTPALEILARAGTKPSAVLAILNFSTNMEDGGSERSRLFWANRLFTSGKVVGTLARATKTYEVELAKLRALGASGVPVLILRPKLDTVRLGETDVGKMGDAFKRQKASTAAFIRHFADARRRSIAS